MNKKFIDKKNQKKNSRLDDDFSALYQRNFHKYKNPAINW